MLDDSFEWKRLETEIKLEQIKKKPEGTLQLDSREFCN